MPISREFLGGDRPALAAAAEYLLRPVADGGTANLADTLVVVPTGRAGRRLLEILVTECEARKLLLDPPPIVTPEVLPEQLYQIKRPLASDLAQRFAWARTLAATPPSLLDHVAPHPPATDDWQGWLELAELIQRQHRELAGDKLNFAAVLSGAKELPGFDEEPRWQTLADVQRRYLALLDSLNVWDKQTARLFAIEHDLCRTEKKLVIVGVSDMTAALRGMLNQTATQGGTDVVALVHAPRAWAERFDALGCILPDVWCGAKLAFDDARVLRVDSAADQAYAVAEQLARLREYAVDDITIGLGDEKLVPQLSRQLHEFNVATRFVNARQVEKTGPYLLLAAVAEYLRTRSFAAFAALARHPDVSDWLREQGVGIAWTSQLDELQNERLPGEFTRVDEWMREHTPAAANALAAITQWLKPLVKRDQSLAAWIEPIEQCLLEIYRHVELSRRDEHDHATLAGCEAVLGGLDGLLHVPESLAPAASATDALELVLQAIAEEPVTPLADERALELLNWFELPLDDSPALIVTSFNEGFVPRSRGADLFLPNRLRQHLGVTHSERSYARDAYAAAILLATRKDVTWIFGRHDGEHNPLAPSRLLFAADRETIAARALRWFDEAAAPSRPKLLLGGAFRPQPSSRLFVPQPMEVPDFLQKPLSVTAFKNYLACPYRFYLKRLLRLSGLSDAAGELDAMQFGNLLHHVLQAFGASEEARQIDDENRLSDWLAETLYTVAREDHGDTRKATVNVQIEQMRLRLRAFAAWQAKHTREGWQIRAVEHELVAPLTFGAHTIDVQGRIDRIDYHPDSRAWLVLDYKSGEAGSDPHKTHRAGEEWIDLQLPLYRRLARTFAGVDGVPQVGYLVLPKDATKVDVLLAEWSDDEWNAADAVACEVVAGMVGRQFWPPKYDWRALDDEVAAICQDAVAGRCLQEIAAEGGAT